MHDKTELIKQLDDIVASYTRLNRVMNAAMEIGCLDPDGKLYEAMWKTWDSMLHLVDKTEWISWFIFDNDCGENAYEAGYDGKLKKIKTTKQLAELIMEADKR